jgi:hypothetical protein
MSTRNTYYICTLLLFAAISIGSKCASSKLEKVTLSTLNNNPEDSLKKYTYLIVKISSDSLYHSAVASGFFIRKNNKLYFVSNYHVFANYDMINGKIVAANLDRMFIRISGQPYEIKINLDSLTKRHLDYKFYNHPDVFSIEINDLSSTDLINTVENFINKAASPDSSSELVSWGFSNHSEEHIDTLTPKKKIGKLAYPFNINPIIRRENKKIRDSINYYPNMKTEHGDSGSPFFYKQNGKMIFAGVVSSGSQTMPQTIIVRPNKIFEAN